MKQEPWAERLEIPTTRLKSYELGRASIRYEVANNFARVFDVNQRWLATGEDPKKPYFDVSPDLSKFIPPRMLFSVVYDKLIGEFVLDEMRRISRFSGLPIEGISREASALDQVGIGAAESGRRDYLVERYKNLLAMSITRIPLSRLVAFGKELFDFFARFEQKNQASVDEYISLHGVGNMAPVRHDQGRAHVAAKLGVPIQSLPTDASEGNDPGLPSHLIFSYADIISEKQSLTYSGVFDVYKERYEKHPNVKMQTNNIENRIKEARNQLGLSQKEAADKWGFPVQTIQQWEQGRRKPRALYLEKIESILAECESKRKPRPGI